MQVMVKILDDSGQQFIDKVVRVSDAATFGELSETLAHDFPQDGLPLTALLNYYDGQQYRQFDPQSPVTPELSGQIVAFLSRQLPIFIVTPRGAFMAQPLQVCHGFPFPDIDQLNSHLQQSLTPEQQALTVEMGNQYHVDLVNKMTGQAIPLQSCAGKSLAAIGLQRSHELLMHIPCSLRIGVPVMGEPILHNVWLTDTWGTIYAQLHSVLTEDFTQLSPRGAFLDDCQNRWLQDDQLVYQAYHPQSSMKISLHPIIHALVITLADGKLSQFVARIAADIPVGDLITDLTIQAERCFGFSTGDGRPPQLSCIFPFGFADTLPGGTLGIAPHQTLRDIGIEQGWAILLLAEDNNLPMIIQPYVTAQRPERQTAMPVERLSAPAPVPATAPEPTPVSDPAPAPEPAPASETTAVLSEQGQA
jgi:hypothetical protein